MADARAEGKCTALRAQVAELLARAGAGGGAEEVGVLPRAHGRDLNSTVKVFRWPGAPAGETSSPSWRGAGEASPSWIADGLPRSQRPRG
jgi:hypothetical protein